MVHELRHDMLATLDADDRARQRFVLALKRELTGRIRPGNQVIFDAKVKPRLQAQQPDALQSREQVRRAMLEEPAYQAWSALTRCSQEMLWATVAEPIFRDRERMQARAQQLRNSPLRRGQLNVDEKFTPPDAMRKVHVHLQPAGYAWTQDDQDVLAGALYEAGGNVYSMGQGMGGDDSKAGALLQWLAKQRPGWRPRRVLDMGCSAGASTVPYAQAFPDAEVHGIDIGGAMVRYAHARSEALGAGANFSQMDSGATSFPDGHFDLIVSHNLFHEISNKNRIQTLRESYRLLAPGGIVIHQDVSIQSRRRTVFEQAERAWDIYFNGEPFWGDYADAEICSELIAAGFSKQTVREIDLPKINGPGAWYAAIAEKPVLQGDRA